MAASGGRIPIATLSAELGWSHRRSIAGFREQVGLPPKQAARLLRFQRASEAVARSASPDRGELAYRCGYYDQSHLTNEFHAFAGDTSGGLVRRRLTAGGYAAD